MRNDNLLSEVPIYVISLPSLIVSLLNFCYSDRHKMLSYNFKFAFPDYISDVENIFILIVIVHPWLPLRKVPVNSCPFFFTG